jgi:hypothetical protein
MALAAIVGVAAPHAARAQLPSTWASASVGAGAFRAGEPYDPGWLFSGRLAVARRLSAATAVSLEAHALSGPTPDEQLNYPDDGSGPTPRPLPDRTLPTTYGVAASVWRGVGRTVTLGAGAGAYRIETRAFAPGGTGLGLHAAAEHTVLTLRRSALTVGARLVYLPNVGGTSAWLLPASLGLRVW